MWNFSYEKKKTVWVFTRPFLKKTLIRTVAAAKILKIGEFKNRKDKNISKT